MAISRISAQDATGNSATTTVSATYPAVPIVRNLLIASVAEVSGGSAITIPGWTTAIFHLDSAGTASIGILYKVAGVGEATLITATSLGSVGMIIDIYEYTGFAGKPIFDRNSFANATSAPIATGTTLTTLYNNELLFAAGEQNVSSTTTSWSNSFNARNSLGIATVPALTLTTADLVVGIKGAYSTAATMGTASGRNTGVIATFYDSVGLPNNYRFVKVGDGMSTSERIR